MRQLTDYEVKYISGSFGLPGAGIGAISGGLGYLGNSVISGNFSWSGFGTSIAVGAASGAVGGSLGSAAARYLAPRIGFLGEAAVGIADKNSSYSMKDLSLFILVNALFISQGIFPFFMSLAFLMMIVFKKISEFNDVKKSMFNPLIKLNLIITILLGIYYASLL